MNIETAQKLIEKLGGIEKSKEIIKNRPEDCTVYREAIGNIVIKEIPIGVIATALVVLGVDCGQPYVAFEPPPKRKEPIDVITAMLEGGYNEVCLKAPIVGYEIVGNPTHARNACHAVKRFKPYCLKKGKYIVDFIDGKCVLENGEVVLESGNDIS